MYVYLYVYVYVYVYVYLYLYLYDNGRALDTFNLQLTRGRPLYGRSMKSDQIWENLQVQVGSLKLEAERPEKA